MSQSLVFSRASAEPGSAISLCDFSLPPVPERGSVHLRFLYAPINPQDLLVIANAYPVKPLYDVDGHPVPGYDGLARVTAVADEGVVDSATAHICPGDLVIPAGQGLGTFRTAAAVPAEQLIRVLPAAAAAAAKHEALDLLPLAMLRMSVLPAYLLLEDVRSLRPGDWVLCNAGRGAIAQMVVQLAHLRGVKVACIVQQKLEQDLALADAVFSEDEVTAGGPARLQQDGRRIVLALDAVCGPAAEVLVDALSPGGTFVNYGSLGGGLDAGFEINSRLLFARGLVVRGFKSSECIGRRSRAEMADLFAWLAGLFLSGTLKAPRVEVVGWDGQETMRDAFRKDRGRLKRVIDFTNAE